MLKFRVATLEDVDEIIPIVEAAYRGNGGGWTTEAHILGGQRTDAEMLAKYITSEHTVVTLAFDGDRPVGCIKVEQVDDVVDLGLFAVDPSRQGAGIGRALVGEAERIAVEVFGAGELHLNVIHVRQDLIGWYERLGFKLNGSSAKFPYGQEQFGLPKRDDLYFVGMSKRLNVDDSDIEAGSE